MQPILAGAEPRRSGCLTVYLVLGMLLYLLSALGLLLIQNTPTAAVASGLPAWAITANLIEAVILSLAPRGSSGSGCAGPSSGWSC